MQLQTGVWTANVDGYEGSLTISAIGPAGDVQASLAGYTVQIQNLNGIWDDTALRLVMLSDPNAGVQEVFEGHLISTPAQAAPGQDIAWTLVGTVQATSLLGLSTLPHRSNARRTQFGWFAHLATVR